MLDITSHQLETWLAQYLWPFIRIGAALMTAPLFSASYVPPRQRLVLAGAITLLVAPPVPPPTGAPFSGAGLVITVQRLVIGGAVGVAVGNLVDFFSVGGGLPANSMGLAFPFK